LAEYMIDRVADFPCIEAPDGHTSYTDLSR
jgi:hypothetical protein